MRIGPTYRAVERGPSKFVEPLLAVIEPDSGSAATARSV